MKGPANVDENTAYWVSCLALLALLLVDCLLLLRRGACSQPVAEPAASSRQVWLQDLVLASLAYGGCLALTLWRLERLPVWLIGGFYVFPTMGCGLLAGAVISQQSEVLARSGAARAVAFACVLGAFGVAPEFCLIAWWLDRRIAAYVRRQSTAGLTVAARRAVLLVLVVYGVAFFLPLNAPRSPERGYFAYKICWEGCLRSFLGQLDSKTGDVFLALPWAANPALWVGLSFMIARRYGTATICAGLALVFGASIKVGAEFCDAYSEIRDAANSPAYYTWLGSMAVLLIAALVVRRRGTGGLAAVELVPGTGT